MNERSSGLLNKTASGKLDVISSDGGARKTRKISKIAAKSTVSQENSQLPVIREAESKVNFLQNQKMIVSQTEQSLSKLLNDEGRERQGIAPTKAKFRFKIKKEVNSILYLILVRFNNKFIHSSSDVLVYQLSVHPSGCFTDIE